MSADLRRGPVPVILLVVAAAGGVLATGMALSGVGPVSAQERTAPRAGDQLREILFNQVTVSSAEASLRVELSGGDELSVAFRDGRVLVDGAEVGSYARGGELERAWRALLGEAIALENDALGRLLAEWSAPTGLEGEAARIARTLEERLGTSLGRSTRTSTQPQDPVVLPAGEDALRLLELLVRDPERLRALAAAAREIPGNGLRVHVGEDIVIPAGEEVGEHLLILDGSLDLAGSVEGDVVVLGGRVTLADEARIGGDLRWSEASVEGNRRAVRGRIEEIRPLADRPEADLREELRQEIQAAMADAVRPERPRRPSRGRGVTLNLLGGISGLVQTAVTFAILLAGGLAVLYFFPRHLEVVARTAQNAPGRAAVVGLAGFVLAFPTWLLGLLVLVVSIIGIPVAILWIPAFPLAVALAVGLGYLAVARNLGRWASRRDFQGLEGLDASRPAVQIGLGIALLLAAFALGHVFQIGGPWFGIFKGLLMAAGFVLTVLASCVGLGAVLLSKGGRDPAFAGPLWDRDDGPEGAAHV